MQFQPKQRNPIGEAIGGSLRDALDYLTQKKLLDLRYKQNENALQALGYPQEKASQLAPVVDSDIFKEIFRSGGGFPGSEGGRSTDAYSKAIEAINGVGASNEIQEPIRQYEQQQRHIVPEQQAAIQRSNARNIVEAYTSKKNPEIQQEAKREKELELKQERAIEKQEKAAEKQEKAAEKEAKILPKVIEKVAEKSNVSPAAQAAEQQLAKAAEAPITRAKPAPLREQINFAGMTPAERKDIQNRILIQEKERKEERNEAHKEGKEYADKAFKSEEDAEKKELLLKDMLKDVKSGDLPNAAVWKTLTAIEENPKGLEAIGALAGTALGGTLGNAVPGVGAVGGGIAGRTAGGVLGYGVGTVASYLAGAAKSMLRANNPNIEKFEKNSASFVQFAQDVLGGGVLTNEKLKAYMDTVPTLMQTDAGKELIINNLLAMTEFQKKQASTLREILKENDGFLPLNVEQIVRDRMTKDREELQNKVLNNIDQSEKYVENKPQRKILSNITGQPI